MEYLKTVERATTISKQEEKIDRLLKILKNSAIRVEKYLKVADVDAVVEVDIDEAIYLVEKLLRRKALVFYSVGKAIVSIYNPDTRILAIVLKGEDKE